MTVKRILVLVLGGGFAGSACTIDGRAASPRSEPTCGLWSASTTRSDDSGESPRLPKIARSRSGISDAKRTKQTINRERIYPSRSRNRRQIFDAAAPTVQAAPMLGMLRCRDRS